MSLPPSDANAPRGPGGPPPETAEREPSVDELLAMAYVDGELDEPSRREVEERLATDSALAREVAELQGLATLARHSVGPEPMDAEWERLSEEPSHRLMQGVGWSLLFVAGVSLLGWMAFELLQSSFSTWLKLVLGGLLLGFLVLFLARLRARLRTLPYDPYTQVKR